MAELLVGVGVLGIVLSAGFAAFRALLFTWTATEARATQKQEAGFALQTLVRELRRAGSRPVECPADPECADPACAGFEALVLARADAVSTQFDDAPADGCPAAAAESIAYSYDSATAEIRRAVGGGPAEALIGNVPSGGFRLRYFAADGTELVPAPALSAAQRAQVREIRVQITTATAHPDPAVAATLTTGLESSVSLRAPNG